MKRKFLSIAMVCLCALTSIPVMNVHAAEAGVTETVAIEDDDFTDSQSKEEDCTVTVDIGSEFTVTIPKKIFLAGENGEGSYDVTAKGNIAALETINVIPENSFLLSSEGKDDVEAVVAQNQTAFTYADVMQVVENVLVGKTTTGNVSADNLSSGNWKGSFYFNINTVKVSRIGVTAIDGNQTDLNTSAYIIEGTEKDALLEKLIASGITEDVTSADDVDALIEVESDDFDSFAEATFTVSNIADDGDTVVILHYNEETGEWEYIGAYEVVDGEVTADFTSFSPVAFVVVQSDGTLHIHEYVVTEEVEATCTTGGSKVYTCECGDSYTEEIEALGHNFVDGVCTRCGKKDPDSVTYVTLRSTASETSTTQPFLGNDTVKRNTVVAVNFVENSTGHYITDSNCWDVSDAQDGSILAWYTQSNSQYTVNIAPKNEGNAIRANKNSSYLLACSSGVKISGIELVDFTGVEDLTSAFSGCYGITEFVIPESMTTVSEKMFQRCYNLKSISIHESVTSIGEYAFKGCTDLISVTIPDSVTSIGNYAFQGCTGLTNVTIPDSITTIGSCAFHSCSLLSNITIPDGVTSISMNVFNGCTGLESITIPDSVTDIGYMAFNGCTGLTSAIIPDSVTSIGNSAFNNCTALSELTVPDSVETIGSLAFYKVPHITYNGTATGSPWGAISIN